MPMWVVQRHSWTRGPSPVPASPWPLFPPACLSLSEPALGSPRRRGVSRSRAWRSAVCSSVGPPHPVSVQRFLLPEGLLFFPGAETSETFYVYLFEETYNSLTLWFYLLILLCLLDFFFFFLSLFTGKLALDADILDWAKLDFSVLITAFFIKVEFDLFVFYFQLRMSDVTSQEAG